MKARRLTLFFAVALSLLTSTLAVPSSAQTYGYKGLVLGMSESAAKEMEGSEIAGTRLWRIGNYRYLWQAQPQNIGDFMIGRISTEFHNDRLFLIQMFGEHVGQDIQKAQACATSVISAISSVYGQPTQTYPAWSAKSPAPLKVEAVERLEADRNIWLARWQYPKKGKKPTSEIVVYLWRSSEQNPAVLRVMVDIVDRVAQKQVLAEKEKNAPRKF